MPEPLPEKEVAAAAGQLIDSLQCPGCNTTLYKVSVSPGAKVRCLHCGARFFPYALEAPAANPAMAGGSATAATALPGREPHSPGYFLVRIPAIVFFVIGLGSAIAAGWALMNELSRGGRGIEQTTLLSYIPLLPLAGLMAILWTRALARIDAQMMHVLWRRGLVSEPLPPPPGSSLPYIAPLGIAGGIIPVWAYKLNPTSPEEMLIPALIGAAVFYFGFAAEDLRQFAWRQYQLAKILNKSGASDFAPFGAIAFSVGFGSFSLLMLDMYTDRGWAPDRLMFAIWFAIMGGLAITSVFVLSAWEQAVDNWRRVAQPLNKRLYPQLLAFVPVLWAGFGILYILSLFVKHGPPHSRDVLPLILVAFALLGWTIGLWRILAGIADWAAATAAIRESSWNKTEVPLHGFSAVVLRGTVVCVIIEAVLFLNMIMSGGVRGDAEALFGIPLAIVALHYPTLWVAAATGEFIRVEQSCAAAVNGDRAEHAP